LVPSKRPDGGTQVEIRATKPYAELESIAGWRFELKILYQLSKIIAFGEWH
jgi:hypothetical protein